MVSQLKPQPLLVRTDANTRIGSGHLMRCLALAQGWQSQGGGAIFITACESEGLRRRLSDEGFQVILLKRSFPDLTDWNITSQTLAAYPGAWVVLDGYHFGPEYQHRIKEAGHPLLVIDDTAHLSHYDADIILNQNYNAKELPYSHESYTRLLTGPQYMLLRSEFLSWQAWPRETPAVARKVLVTLGGSDPNNQSWKVMKALQQVEVDELEAVVVVGADNPYLNALQAACHDSRFPMQLVCNVANMAELMAWAEVAISAGGRTCWEMAFMGLPHLILLIADNQRTIMAGLPESDAAILLGWWEQVSSREIAQVLEALITNGIKRAAMSRSGRQLVDGQGAERLVGVLRS